MEPNVTQTSEDEVTEVKAVEQLRTPPVKKWQRVTADVRHPLKSGGGGNRTRVPRHFHDKLLRV